MVVVGKGGESTASAGAAEAADTREVEDVRDLNFSHPDSEFKSLLKAQVLFGLSTLSFQEEYQVGPQKNDQAGRVSSLKSVVPIWQGLPASGSQIHI